MKLGGAARTPEVVLRFTLHPSGQIIHRLIDEETLSILAVYNHHGIGF
jgi:hypothetical protein